MNLRNYTAAGSALGMLLLILDSRCALESGRMALELCIRTVIPSLFPFLYLSCKLSGSLPGNTGRFMKGAAAAAGIPPGMEVLFPAGFLGGYPAGAAAVGRLFRLGQIQKETAGYLLSFCSNAGPAFLFGMVSLQFPERRMAWQLWGIHILSAALVGTILPLPGDRQILPQPDSTPSADPLGDAIRIQAMICGWILLFRILLGFLDRWFLWLLPEAIRVLIWGLLELSNGCCALAQIESIPARFVTAAAMISFGGLCVMLQTASVIRGLPMTGYLRGKLLQSAFSVLLAAAVVKGWWPLMVIGWAMVLILSRIRKKSSSNPALSGV